MKCKNYFTNLILHYICLHYPIQMQLFIIFFFHFFYPFINLVSKVLLIWLWLFITMATACPIQATHVVHVIRFLAWDRFISLSSIKYSVLVLLRGVNFNFFLDQFDCRRMWCILELFIIYERFISLLFIFCYNYLFYVLFMLKKLR